MWIEIPDLTRDGNHAGRPQTRAQSRLPGFVPAARQTGEYRPDEAAWFVGRLSSSRSGSTGREILADSSPGKKCALSRDDAIFAVYPIGFWVQHVRQRRHNGHEPSGRGREGSRRTGKSAWWPHKIPEDLAHVPVVTGLEGGSSSALIGSGSESGAVADSDGVSKLRQKRRPSLGKFCGRSSVGPHGLVHMPAPCN